MHVSLNTPLSNENISRPGEKITMKTIQVQKKMKELDRKEMKSKSLIANILDMDDDFPSNNHHSYHSTVKSNTVHPSHPNYPQKPPLANIFMTRSNPNLQNLPNSYEEQQMPASPLQRELNLILKEIRIITDKIRDDDEASEVEADWKFAAMVLDR